MFRKPVKKRPQMSRQREEEAEEDAAEIVKDSVKRKRRENPMVQSTKKKTTQDQGSSSDDSDMDDLYTEHAIAASGSEVTSGIDMNAAEPHSVDTDISCDAQAQFERVQKELKEGGGVEKDGKILYKGMAMYGAKIVEDTPRGSAASKFNRVGPIRAPQFLRQTVRWDYAPDICKDYKETGFCTFGDSCKFLHDRSDYKHGWEIERDFEAGTLNKEDEENYEIAEEDEDAFPEECFICLKPFENPVVTRCKHYFCEACALNAFRKSKKCKVCEQNTGGVFNVAKDLIQKMADRQKKQEQEKQEADSDEEVEEKHVPATCDHDHDHQEPSIEEENIVKEEPEEMTEETNEEEGSIEDNEEPIQAEEQEEIEIKMEDASDDDEEEIDDEEEFDEGEAPAATD